MLDNFTVLENGCWRWDGEVSLDGYPSSGGPVYYSIYRTIYAEHYGPIPRGLVLDHRCHTDADCEGGRSCAHRLCVNPAHKEPVTQSENIRRKFGYTPSTPVGGTRA